jgi:hypothetical protein
MNSRRVFTRTPEAPVSMNLEAQSQFSPAGGSQMRQVACLMSRLAFHMALAEHETYFSDPQVDCGR